MQSVALSILVVVAGHVVLGRPVTAQELVVVEPPQLPSYITYRTSRAPTIDGQLTETSWQLARWTESFTDIEDPKRVATLETRVKMLWNSTHLFIGAELEDPDLWGTLTTRDTVLYTENDFEVFLDPNGDTHDYYELEVNVLGTVWDLMLTKPYRDRGRAISTWDIRGLQSVVDVQGTVNQPGDKDGGWTIEIAIPWNAFTEQRVPSAGDQWRVNFSRVHWPLMVVDSAYQKVVDTTSGRPMREQNWVWAVQGAINMHMPEMWGIVQFSDVVVGRGREALAQPEDRPVRWALRELYYAQRSYRREHDQFASSLEEMGIAGFQLPDGTPLIVELEMTDDGYVASGLGADGETTWRIREDGRAWRE
jgi:hypothetical protein